MQRYRNARGAVRSSWRRLPPDRLLRLVLSHAIIVLSGMYIVLYVLDHNGRSKSMNFINNEITKALLLVLVLLSIFNAALALVRMHKGIGEKEMPNSAPREALRPQERPANRQPPAYARSRVGHDDNYSGRHRTAPAPSAPPRHSASPQRPIAYRSDSYSRRRGSGY